MTHRKSFQVENAGESADGAFGAGRVVGGLLALTQSVLRDGDDVTQEPFFS